MWLTDAWKHFEFCSLAHTVWHETLQLGSLLWKSSQNSVLLQTCEIYFHVCTVLLYVMMELMLWDMAGSHMKARQRYAMAPSMQHIYIWGGKFWEAKITWHKVKVSVLFQTMNRYAVWYQMKKSNISWIWKIWSQKLNLIAPDVFTHFALKCTQIPSSQDG